MKNKQPNPMTRTGRKQQAKKEAKETQPSGVLSNKWVHGSVIVMAVLTFLVSAILIIWKTTQAEDPSKTLGDYSTFFSDVAYSITLDEKDDEIIGFITSEELEVQDAVQLSEAIRSDMEKEVELYVYETEEERTIAPEFYEEDLRYSVLTYPNNSYETRLFYNMPTIEANVESVRKWHINEKDSYVSAGNVLHVAGEVPTMASTEEAVAFLKGLDSVVSDLNEDSYSNTYYSVKQGLNKLLFSANHPQVIADVEMYHMANTNK